MDSKANYTLVGTVVLLMILLIVVGLMWLAGAGDRQEASFYTIYFSKQSLDGLQADGDVTMKGIKVGSVNSFQISPENIEQVKVLIKVNVDTPIKVDTRAVIKRNLLTGLARIDLINSKQESEALVHILPREKYPVILEGRTELTTITDSIPNLVENANKMIEGAVQFFSADNQEAFNGMLANGRKLSSMLTDNSEHFVILIKDLDKLSVSLNKLAINTDRRLERIENQLQETIANVNNTAENIEEISETGGSALQLLLREVTNLSQELRQAAQAITTTVEKFEDPSAIIGGPSKETLGPGETATKTRN